MQIGKIIDIPRDGGYGRVRDEHGEVYSVRAGEFPENAQDGDDYAYRVSFQSHKSGSITLENVPEDD